MANKQLQVTVSEATVARLYALQLVRAQRLGLREVSGVTAASVLRVVIDAGLDAIEATGKAGLP